MIQLLKICNSVFFSCKIRALKIGVYLLVQSVFSRLSSFSGRLQNPVLLELSCKKVCLEGLPNLLLCELEDFARSIVFSC